MVLAAAGTILALFVPVLGGAGPLSTAISAQTTASVTLDAVAEAHDTLAAGTLTPCEGTQPPGTPGGATNEPPFANPCVLGPLAPSVRISGAQEPSRAATTAAVAAQPSASGWLTAVTVAQAAASGDQVTACHTVLRTAPGALETFLTHPAQAGEDGCSAAFALTLAAQVPNCAPGTGASWGRACDLSAHMP